MKTINLIWYGAYGHHLSNIIMTHRFFYVFMFLFTFSVSYAQIDKITKEELLDAGLPVVEITSVDEEWPTCEIVSGIPYGINVTSIANANKVPGRLTISTKNAVLYDSGDYEKGKSGMTFKIRGNTSGKADKKPYKIKLQKKADLLCRNNKIVESKDWVLIFDKNYYNKIGFKVNELMGLQWTPAYEYVNVMINGKYQGLYMLLESVERDKDCRINVSKSGYIFEYDMYWWKEDLYVKIDTYLPWKMYYTFKYPEAEDMTDDQLAYFREMITAVEASITNGTYPNYIDLNSFTSWMLAHDILGTADGSGSNIYLTKYDNTDDSKVMMGNMWDFDSIFQITSDWSAVHTMFYFRYLFNMSNPNSAFIRAYRKQWERVSPTIFNDLNKYIDDFAQSEEAAALNISAEWDNQLWGWTLKNHQIDNLAILIKKFFNDRKSWLNRSISSFPSCIKGDVNLDGKVNEKDLAALVAHIMGRDSDDIYGYDVDGNKVVNAVDIVELIKIIRK